MAKSKQQKQQEALDRKRAQFPEKMTLRLKYNPGGNYYENCKRFQGQELADKRAAEHNIAFGRYLKEAQLDTHGNHLKEPDLGKVQVLGAGSSIIIGRGLIHMHLDGGW